MQERVEKCGGDGRTCHEGVSEVILSVLVRLDIGPFEVGAAAAGE